MALSAVRSVRRNNYSVNGDDDCDNRDVEERLTAGIRILIPDLLIINDSNIVPANDRAGG
jgi:hypothetical protein